MDDLTIPLEKLSKPRLIDLIVTLAEKSRSNYGIVLSEIDPRDEQGYMIQLKEALTKKIRQTTKRAEQRSDGKPLYFDTSDCVHDVENIFHEWIEKKTDTLSSILQLKAIMHLVPDLIPNLEAKIYDFQGDAVLTKLDLHAVKMLEKNDVTDIELLKDVALMFSTDSKEWANCQDYGLFEEAPSNLKSGEMAKKLLKVLQDENRKHPREVDDDEKKSSSKALKASEENKVETTGVDNK